MGRLRSIIGSTEGSSAFGAPTESAGDARVLITVPILAAQTKASKPVPQSAPPAVGGARQISVWPELLPFVMAATAAVVKPDRT